MLGERVPSYFTGAEARRDEYALRLSQPEFLRVQRTLFAGSVAGYG
jgi:hypothetical protein